MKYEKGRFDPDRYIKDNVEPLIERASSLGEHRMPALKLMFNVISLYGSMGFQGVEKQRIGFGGFGAFKENEAEVKKLMLDTADVGYDFGTGVRNSDGNYNTQFEKLLIPLLESSGEDVDNFRAKNRTIQGTPLTARSDFFSRN